MGLESKLKKILTCSVLSVALAFNACGESNKLHPATQEEPKECIEKTIYLGPDSVYGSYSGNYSVTEDPQDRIPPENEHSEFNTWVLRLGSDSRMRMSIFEEHDYDRDTETGEFCDSWDVPVEGGNYNLSVCGVLTNNWDLSAEARSTYTSDSGEGDYSIAYDITCMKDPLELDPECLPNIVGAADTLYGNYIGEYTTLEDESDVIPEENEIGPIDIEVMTLGNDAYIGLDIFERHGFLRDLHTGEICDEWGPPIPLLNEAFRYTVCGTITDDGELNLHLEFDNKLMEYRIVQDVKAIRMTPEEEQ